MLKYLIIMSIPIFAFAASSGSGETDIFWRTINFVIFAGIAYYILADRVKAYFVGRKDAIAKRLTDIEERLQESKLKKAAAEDKVKEARVTAKSFLATSQKENKLLLDKLNNDLNNEIDNLDKAQKDQMEIERRKITRAVINDVLDELFDKNISIDKSKFVDIVTKKVS